MLPMDCPKCGYVMAPFDKECPRCQHATAAPIETTSSPTGAMKAGYKQCPACGFATPVVTRQCPQCAHKFRTEFVPPPQPEAASKTTTIGCVQCGNQNVQKVSALAHADGPAEGSGPVGELLLPPKRPEYATPPIVYAALVATTLAVLAAGSTVIAKFDPMEEALTVSLGVVAIGLSILAALRVGSEKTRHAVRETLYHQAMTQWNMLFYCPKCDCVYNITTRKSAPSKAMRTLLGPS